MIKIMMDVDLVLNYVAIFVAVLIVMPAHEFAHAFAAVKSGDDTPKASGRYTLNPMAHFDVVGLLMLMFAHFGWAKPVPINPYNFRDIKKGYFWTSVAGVLTNIAMAFLVYPLFLVYQNAFFDVIFSSSTSFVVPLVRLGYYVLKYVFMLNINLFVFNLIPVYPLDGFRVVEVFNKKHGKVFCFLRDQGYKVLFVLMVISALNDSFDSRFIILEYLDVFGRFMEIVTGWVSIPILGFWDFILRLFVGA